MAPKITVTRQEILNAAYGMAKNGGIEAINARDLAKAIGCSTQPIFREFARMEDVKREVLRMAKNEYFRYIEEGLKEELPFKGAGKAYIRFAKEERELFRMLFMSGDEMSRALLEDDGEIAAMRGIIGKTTSLKAENVEIVRLCSWIFVHGIAALSATEVCELPESFIDDALTYEFMGIYKYLESKEKK